MQLQAKFQLHNFYNLSEIYFSCLFNLKIKVGEIYREIHFRGDLIKILYFFWNVQSRNYNIDFFHNFLKITVLLHIYTPLMITGQSSFKKITKKNNREIFYIARHALEPPPSRANKFSFSHPLVSSIIFLIPLPSKILKLPRKHVTQYKKRLFWAKNRFYGQINFIPIPL